MHSLDTSFPAHRVHFNVVASHGQREQLQAHNQSIREPHPQPHAPHELQREQRFISNNHPDENSIKISIAPHQQRLATMPIVSLEKGERLFHSPARKETAPKVQFFTEKKVRESEEMHSGRQLEVRQVREIRQVREVRRGSQGFTAFGLVPLFH